MASAPQGDKNVEKFVHLQQLKYILRRVQQFMYENLQNYDFNSRKISKVLVQYNKLT